MIGALDALRSYEALHSSRVAVVGGGVLGTTLALRYRQAGRVVTLFEATSRLERRGHTVVSRGDRALIRLLDELDLSRSIVWEAGHRLASRFGQLPGGRSQIISTMRERAHLIGVEVRTGTPVHAVRACDGGFAVETDDGVSTFEEVILAVPSPVAAWLADDLPAEERHALTDIGYVGIVTAAFALDRPIGRRYVSRVDRNGDRLAIVDPAALQRKGEAQPVVYVSSAARNDDALFVAEDRQLLEEFARALPLSASISSGRVVRMPHAFARQRRSTFSTSLPGLSIVNAAHQGAGMNHLDRTAALATAAFRTLCAEHIY